MERAKRDTMLGLVFFGGLALLLWATAKLSNLSLADAEKITVLFPNAAQLREGDNVYVLGKHNGQVTGIELQPGNRRYPIRVIIQLREPLVLKTDARIRIEPSNLLGGKQIEIDPGGADRIWPPDRPYTGAVEPNAFQALSDMVAGDENKENLRGALSGLNRLFEKLNDPSGSIGAVIYKSDLYDELLAFVSSARASAEALQTGRGALPRLLHDADVGEDMSRAMSSVRSIAGKVDSGEGVIGELLNSRTLAESVRTAVADLGATIADVRAGKGAVGRLLRDEGMAADLQATITSVRSVAAKADDPGAGAIGALLADPSVRQDLVDVFDDVAAATAAVRRGEGVLGVLIHDRDMAQQLQRIMRQVARTIEDAREAAPVGTFIQVLGGVF